MEKIRIPFTAICDNKEFAAEMRLVEFVMIERTYGVDITDPNAATSTEAIMFGAWHALKRTGQTALEFEDWLPTVEGYEVEGDAPDPKSAPPTEALQSSPTG